MRELEQLRDKPELTLAILLALIHGHKQHKTPGNHIIDKLLLLLNLFPTKIVKQFRNMKLK
mgnify:CR=1 FL=1